MCTLGKFSVVDPRHCHCLHLLWVEISFVHCLYALHCTDRCCEERVFQNGGNYNQIILIMNHEALWEIHLHSCL